MQIDNTDEPFRVKEEAEKQGIICILLGLKEKRRTELSVY